MYSCGLLDTNWGKIRAKHKYVRWCCGREMGRILIIDFFFCRLTWTVIFWFQNLLNFQHLKAFFSTCPPALLWSAGCRYWKVLALIWLGNRKLFSESACVLPNKWSLSTCRDSSFRGILSLMPPKRFYICKLYRNNAIEGCPAWWKDAKQQNELFSIFYQK